MLEIEINEQERQAINLFLSEHWMAFGKCASAFMTDDEIDDLGRKLDGED